MIPADPNLMAVFEGPDGKPSASRTVVAWADDGHPMVLGERGLLRAEALAANEDVGQFRRVRRRTDELPPCVAAVPGGGWLVDTWWEDGACTTAPVLLWTVHSDGSVVPVDTDFHGVTSSALGAGERSYVYHPDHDSPDARKQAGFPGETR
jgi:hypothetical protein